MEYPLITTEYTEYHGYVSVRLEYYKHPPDESGEPDERVICGGVTRSSAFSYAIRILSDKIRGIE